MKGAARNRALRKGFDPHQPQQGVITSNGSVISGLYVGVEGLLVDASGEYGYAHLTIPDKVATIDLLEIKARSVGQYSSMVLDVYVEGAADDEPYNTHTAYYSGLVCTTTDFISGDIITWQITSGLNSLSISDSVKITFMSCPAVGTSSTTNAYLRTYYLEFN